MNTELNELLSKQPILLFDGECGFCNHSVQFFLRHEKNNKMNFAALQSKEARLIKDYFELDDKIDSIILIKDHEAHIKSCAALRLTLYMKGLWPLFIIFIIIPPFIRNFFYDLIAKKRMKFFGRVESCSLLKKEDQKRFLDSGQ